MLLIFYQNICLAHLLMMADIDECKDPNLNDCDVNAICINTPGSFNCSCIDNYFGDGRTDRRGCIAKASQFPVIKFSLGT